MSVMVDLFDAVSLPVKIGWGLWIVWGVAQMLAYRTLRAVTPPESLPEVSTLESNAARRRPSATRPDIVDPPGHTRMKRRRRRHAPSPAPESSGQESRVA